MTKKNTMTWAAFGLLFASMVVACSDSKTETPSTNISLGGKTSRGGSSAGGSSAAETGGAAEQGGATSADGGSTVAAGAPSSGGLSAAAGASSLAGAAGAGATAGATAGAPAVAGAAGQSTDCQDTTGNCYRCAASSNAQLLNHCTDNRCVAFDNKTLTKIVNGQLPPIP
jgi:hypothetical protein